MQICFQCMKRSLIFIQSLFWTSIFNKLFAGYGKNHDFYVSL